MSKHGIELTNELGPGPDPVADVEVAVQGYGIELTDELGPGPDPVADVEVAVQGYGMELNGELGPGPDPVTVVEDRERKDVPGSGVEDDSDRVTVPGYGIDLSRSELGTRIDDPTNALAKDYDTYVREVTSYIPQRTKEWKQKLVIVSDAEPDDLVALVELLHTARLRNMKGDKLLIIGCGRDPRDAQHILQCMVNEYYSDVHVAQGAPSKSKPFEHVADVFPGQKKTELKNEATDLLASVCATGAIDIVNLSTLRDLYLAKDKIHWRNLCGMYISGGSDQEDRPSFNLRDDSEAFKGMVDKLHPDSYYDVYMFGPILYKTSMRGHLSIHPDTQPQIHKAIWESTKPVAKYIREWVAVWDKQLERDSPVFAKRIPHLGRQFTPAALFPAAAWCDPKVIVAKDECSLAVEPLADKPEWFSLKTKAPMASTTRKGSTRYVNRVLHVDMQRMEKLIVGCFS